MGDRGRLVITAELVEGTPIVLLDTAGGVVLMSREQLKSRVRSELAGLELVEELLAERSRAAEVEDSA